MAAQLTIGYFDFAAKLVIVILYIKAAEPVNISPMISKTITLLKVLCLLVKLLFSQIISVGSEAL